VLVCLGKESSNEGAFEAAQHFAVNILAETQRDVSAVFATRGINRFGSINWRRGDLGDPILEGSTAWFECRMHDRIDAGDHIILVGNVQSYDHSTASPLGYCRGTYVSFQLEQDIVAGRNRKTRVGAILEAQGRILFLASKSGMLALPTNRALGAGSEPGTLRGDLAALGVSYDLDFLYSVYEENDTDTLNVFYRGTAAAVPSVGGVIGYTPEEIPLDRLEGNALRKLMCRYINERLHARFSVYAGDATVGRFKIVVDS